MTRSLMRMVLGLLGLVWAALTAIGVTVAAQNLSGLAIMAVVGAGSGVFVGASISWSRDRDVTARDAGLFAGAGLAIVFGVTGAGALEGLLPPLAVLAMLLAAWLLHASLRDGETSQRTGARRGLPHIPRHCETLPPARLHELWELLLTADTDGEGQRSKAPDPRVVELRSRVLDALARCDPDGYEAWLRTDAPRNVAGHVGRQRPA